MSRELAGVIACVQEIEIALQELEAKPQFKSNHGLQEIRKLIRNFFAQAGRQSASALESFLRLQLKQHGAYAILHEPVVVDGTSTSLSGLTDELTELLEDLPQ